MAARLDNELAARATKGDRDAEEELLRGADRYLRSIITSVTHGYFQCDLGDMMQAARLGLIEALRVYNPAKGSISTFAWSYIRDRVILETRHRYPVTLSKDPMRQIMALRQIINKCAEENARISVKDMASQLNTTEGTATQLLIALAQPVPLDDKRCDEDITSISEMIPADGNDFERADKDMDLERGMSALSTEEREIIEMIWYDNKARSAIASDMGVSPMTILRREQRALAKMRTIMAGKIGA